MSGWGWALGAAGGYLAGSVPFSYLLVRMVRGVDMRRYGSRTVSATMVGVLVSRPAAAVVGLLGIAKGLLPVWLGYQLAPEAALFPGVIGLSAVIGHCWPVWLGFRGGRGVSVMMGALLVFFPWGTLWVLAALGLGRLLRAGATAVLVGLALLPVLAAVLGAGPAAVQVCAGFLLVTVVKRLEANREPLPPQGAGRVALRRLLKDRDVENWSDWLGRGPD